MKKVIKYSRYVAIALALCATVILGCRCSTSAPDPLAGFHHADEANMDKNKAITDDYKDYLQKLPSGQKGYIGPILYYENEAGQHAVDIQIFEGNKNASWEHVLIYDKDNKRIKVVRYNHVKYQS